MCKFVRSNYIKDKVGPSEESRVKVQKPGFVALPFVPFQEISTAFEIQSVLAGEPCTESVTELADI